MKCMNSSLKLCVLSWTTLHFTTVVFIPLFHSHFVNTRNISRSFTWTNPKTENLTKQRNNMETKPQITFFMSALKEAAAPSVKVTCRYRHVEPTYRLNRGLHLKDTFGAYGKPLVICVTVYSIWSCLHACKYTSKNSPIQWFSFFIWR